MIEAIAGIGTAFGLSGSAGLNAYIPLLVVALAARFPVSDPLLELSSPYDLLASWWVIGLLVILLIIEMLVDMNPILAIMAGVLVAGGVHATKAVVRPAVTATTAGTGNWAVSIVEDITAFFVSLMAILIPVLAGIVVLVFVALIIWFFIRRRRRKQRGMMI
jgi:hypothetical protein